MTRRSFKTSRTAQAAAGSRRSSAALKQEQMQTKEKPEEGKLPV